MGGEKKAEYDKFWGGKKVKEYKFKIVDERQLEQKIKEKEQEVGNVAHEEEVRPTTTCKQ
jgi:hypothetical protein